MRYGASVLRVARSTEGAAAHADAVFEGRGTGQGRAEGRGGDEEGIMKWWCGVPAALQVGNTLAFNFMPR